MILLKGGGGVVHPNFFVKLYFEIAFDQQTKAHVMTEFSKEFRTPGARGTAHAHIWSTFSSHLPNHLNILKIMLWGTPREATSLLNTYIKFYQIG